MELKKRLKGELDFAGAGLAGAWAGGVAPAVTEAPALLGAGDGLRSAEGLVPEGWAGLLASMGLAWSWMGAKGGGWGAGGGAIALQKGRWLITLGAAWRSWVSAEADLERISRSNKLGDLGSVLAEALPAPLEDGWAALLGDGAGIAGAFAVGFGVGVDLDMVLDVVLDAAGEVTALGG